MALLLFVLCISFPCCSCTVADLQNKIDCLEKTNSKLQEEVCVYLLNISRGCFPSEAKLPKNIA